MTAVRWFTGALFEFCLLPLVGARYLLVVACRAGGPVVTIICLPLFVSWFTVVILKLVVIATVRWLLMAALRLFLLFAMLLWRVLCWRPCRRPTRISLRVKTLLGLVVPVSATFKCRVKEVKQYLVAHGPCRCAGVTTVL